MTQEMVLNFWFQELTPKQWFAVDPAVDAETAKRFSEVHRQACACELEPWRATVDGALAEILVLDQFSRNIFRRRPEAFAQDALALALAQEAVRRGMDRLLPVERQPFCYLPFMHSESRRIHERAVQLFQAPGLEDNLKFEHRHKAIIDRFGRFPHRNQVLGRPSTVAEIEFLKQPGSSF